MDAKELLAIAKRDKPNVRYAANRAENGIAAWDEALGRWVLVAAKTLFGTWVGQPMELLVNGVPAWPQEDWIEFSGKAV